MQTELADAVSLSLSNIFHVKLHGKRISQGPRKSGV